MWNIEIKCPLPERETVERRLGELGARESWRRLQRDTFFAVSDGWLKLREADGAAPELIAYRRATGSGAPRPSHYIREPLSDAGRWKELLGHVLALAAVVEKERTLWLWRHTRVHLDRVQGLGEFLELETVGDGIREDEARTENALVIERLGLDPASFLSVPYKVLLEREV